MEMYGRRILEIRQMAANTDYLDLLDTTDDSGMNV